MIPFYTKNSNITTSSISSQIFKITPIKSVFDQSEFFPFINRLFGHRNCDATKWKSPLIEKYGVAITLTVDQKGCGKFNSVQKAVDAVPDNALKPTLIILDAGTYREKVNVEKTKSNLIIQGQGYGNTFIVWGDTAKTSNGTVYSYSVGVFAKNFIAHDVSFKNTAPYPSPSTRDAQAVALRIAGDQAAFYSCGFYGFQDTLLADAGRHYFKNCFIEGTTDFIFGNGRSLFENCTINSVASGSGAVAAQKRESLQEKTGFSFLNCKIVGKGNIFLGRAWGAYSTTVYIKTTMDAIIAPEGWNDMGNSTRDQIVFFGEYACSGLGANFNGRVKYARQLSATDAAPYMSIAYIDGKEWLREL
ncbi:hypothetical protein SSX86_023239 [Deinandra increscens subsp. villosa]|uniref:Pectinesterase n=1 Tax=Deinandra increscens subsp. villosa TaxID=3103831 RepID=A0AAP0CQG9_9ASTR